MISACVRLDHQLVVVHKVNILPRRHRDAKIFGNKFPRESQFGNTISSRPCDLLCLRLMYDLKHRRRGGAKYPLNSRLSDAISLRRCASAVKNKTTSSIGFKGGRCQRDPLIHR